MKGKRLINKQIYYQEKILQSINNGVDGQYWFPVFSQDVEAYISLKVNVWMVNLCFTLHFGGLMRVTRANFETESKLPSSVKSLYRKETEKKNLSHDMSSKS